MPASYPALVGAQAAEGASDRAAPLPAGHPPVEQNSAQRAHPSSEGSAGHTAHPALDRIDLAQLRDDTTLATGTLTVDVRDQAGEPVNPQQVRLGSLGSDGSRSETHRVTDATGAVTFANLKVDSSLSYRVTVPYRGATYASTPFRMPEQHGARLTITVLPTTRRDDRVVQALGQAFFEFRRSRLHVMQQAQLVNVGHETYLFPEGGTLVRLPKGAMAVETQPVMTDQRLEVVDDGIRIAGSLPPGRVELAWAFDLDLSDPLSFDLSLPWRTFMVRIFSEAAQGMRVELEGLTAAQLVDSGEQRAWLSETRFAADARQPEHVGVRLVGLPGPGPGRWIALAVALVLVLGGFLVRKPGTAGRSAFQRERADLRAQAEELERLHAQGEVGEVYVAERRAELVDSLALLLAAQRKGERSENPG